MVQSFDRARAKTRAYARFFARASDYLPVCDRTGGFPPGRVQLTFLSGWSGNVLAKFLRIMVAKLLSFS